MPDLYFEDIIPGAVSVFGPYRVPRNQMLAFARDFDPQPFHLDEAAAAASSIGRLIASGWYSASLQMRMLCDGWLSRAACLGGLGIDDLRWLKPVAAGDLLSTRQTILETRVSARRPDLGIVRFSLDLMNGAGETVMTVVQAALLGRRDGPPAEPIARPEPAPEPAPFAPVEDPERAPRTYDDIEVGRGIDLGCYTFTADRIVAFARQYDPQYFHLDEVAAADGPFGGLAASGWHTGAGWMSRYAARLDRLREAGAAPRISVSPGIRDLRWLRPVYAGDTIRYASEPIAKRPSASRPGWGIVSSRNAGRNGRGETVFEFVGNVFWAMRDTPIDRPMSARPAG